MIPVFFIEPTDRSRRWLRRYAAGPCPLSAGNHSTHDVMVQIEDGHAGATSGDLHPHDDPRWAAACGCGYAFRDSDNWQLFHQTVYRRPDTGEECTLRDAPVGACYNASWMADRRTAPAFYVGDDGRCLVVKTPGGEWMIDARASNCTLPDDNTHKCWVRHGRPEDGTLHVDKNGHTCAAGAGSIIAGSYHGFLHNGHLTAC